jgi:putative FmdB family regulatory protein
MTEGFVPTYEYLCTDHGHRLEVVQKFTDDALTVCPECGGHLRKVIFPVGVVFKGSGFYRNDSRAGANGSSRGAAGDTGKDGAGKDGAGKDGNAKDGAAKDGGSSASGAKDGAARDSGSKDSGSGNGGTSSDGGSKNDSPATPPATAPAAAPVKATTAGSSGS